MADPEPRIDVSRIKVAGFGGLGLVLVGLIVGWSMPAIRPLMIAGLVGGAIGGVAFVKYRRKHQRPTDAHGPTLHLVDEIARQDPPADSKTVSRLSSALEPSAPAASR